jgi:hypothetical protein
LAARLLAKKRWAALLAEAAVSAGMKDFELLREFLDFETEAVPPGYQGRLVVAMFERRNKVA